MCRRLFGIIMCALAASPVAAQSPFSIALGGGVSFPEGDGLSTGWHALGSVVVSSLMHPIGLRLDLAHSQSEFSSDVLPAIDGNSMTSSATLNLTYRLPMTNSPFSPYVIAGAGAYSNDCTGCESDVDFGWNAGAGTRLRVARFLTIIEARYHRAQGPGYIPITIGLIL